MLRKGNYFVVVPVFNEEENISSFLHDLRKHTDKIVVVNDGSTDKTKSILDRFKNIHVIHQKENKGKGRAMKTGARKALRLGADGVVFMDGDNQHDPKHLQEFFSLLEADADIVIGVRMIKAKIPFIRRLGNMIFVHLIGLLFNVQIPDILCGFRGFSKKGLKSVKWTSEGYGVETEMITIIGRKRLPYNTVVVDTIYLDKYKGFSVTGGLKILSRLLYWKYQKI